MLEICVVGAHDDAGLQSFRALLREYDDGLDAGLRIKSIETELSALAQRYAAGALLLALDDGLPVGCAILHHFDAGKAEVKRLYVKPQARRSGTGRALVMAAIELARERGYASVVLDTHRHRLAAAYALYRSLGFEQRDAYSTPGYADPTYLELPLLKSENNERRGPLVKARDMIALQFDRFGQPVDVVTPSELPVPQPGAGEVRLQLVRSPIHNHDLSTIRGTYGVKPALPAIAGTEMLATVDAVGDGVTNVKPGQRVGAMLSGAWAQYAISPAASLVPIPDAIDDDTGAQMLAMPLSAVVLFEDLQVAAGDWIVQNAANGAVGRIVMRLAQKAGVNIVNLVRRQSSAGELTSYGAEHVVNTDDPQWPQRVRDTVKDGKIVRVIDSVCDAQSLSLNRLLAPQGQHVIFGALASTPLMLDPGALIFGETSVRGFWMTAVMQRATAAQRGAAVGRVFALALAGELPLPVGGVYPLSDAAKALAEAEKPGRPGKILFRPS
jgi:NADPH2:quinone reductase